VAIGRDHDVAVVALRVGDDGLAWHGGSLSAPAGGDSSPLSWRAFL
jgi:hypothetical protein